MALIRCSDTSGAGFFVGAGLLSSYACLELIFISPIFQYQRLHAHHPESERSEKAKAGTGT